MACKGRLHRVKPKNGKTLWSVEAILKFVELTKDVELLASVTARKEAIYELSIFNKDVNISDFMIMSGLADPTPDSSESMHACLVSHCAIQTSVTSSTFHFRSRQSLQRFKHATSLGLNASNMARRRKSRINHNFTEIKIKTFVKNSNFSNF